jgi:hypothetical protein
VRKSTATLETSSSNSGFEHVTMQGSKIMRAYIFALTAAMAFALPTAASAQPVADQPSQAEPSRKCEELRKACLHKDELGERGEGNCKWYRENCR